MTLVSASYDLIQDKGRNITLQKITAGTYDPDNSEVVNSSTSYTVKALVLNYSSFYVAQGLVQAGDRKIVLAANELEVVPAAGDKVVVDGVTMLIVSVRRTEESGELVIFVCQVRA